MSEELKQEVRSFVEEELKKQVEYCVKEYGLEDWFPALEVTFAANRKISKAGRNVHGRPFISLALREYLLPVNGFLEYPDYSANAFIGSFKSNDRLSVLRALVAHELAHAVQFTLPVAKSKKAVAFYNSHKNDAEDHGKLFKEIYMKLRKKFVNEHVPYYNMGIDPPPIVIQPKGPFHPYVGKHIMHKDLGRCIITNFNKRAWKYPIEFMDLGGITYKCSEDSFKKKTRFV